MSNQQKSADAVSNAEFLTAMFSGLAEGEFLWHCHNASNPDKLNDPKSGAIYWGGRPLPSPGKCQDFGLENAYFCVASLRTNKGAKKRRKDNFSRLFLLVLDDVPQSDLTATYVLETSPGKYHYGFKLREPIADIELADRLVRAAIDRNLLGVDKSGNNSVRYMRLPKGANAKHTPPYVHRLVQWNPQNLYSLDQLISILELDADFVLRAPEHAQNSRTAGARPAHLQGAQADGTSRPSDEELIAMLCTGESYHEPSLKLAARYARRGHSDKEIKEILRGILQANGDDSERKRQRLSEIDAIVDSAIEKYGAAGDSSAPWQDPVDPFIEWSAPPFPLDALPSAIRQFCERQARTSGFDVGGYAFAALVAAAGLIDHRIKFKSGPLSVPSLLWGGLLARSGSGKSPIIKAAASAVQKINMEVVKQSKDQHDAWFAQYGKYKDKKKKTDEGQTIPEQPPFRQVITMDTTIEGLAKTLADNPRGVILSVDELAEFIGRMDSYSNSGPGKERGKFLTSFDGGPQIINRASYPVPLWVENFSMAVLTGVQPEKLFDLFRRGGGAADGLYQRFLLYCLAPAGQVRYEPTVDVASGFEDMDFSEIYKRIYALKFKFDLTVCIPAPEVLPKMQAFHQMHRDYAQFASSPRFAEHLDKFPGFLARVMLTLHVLESTDKVGTGNMPNVIGEETFDRANMIMQCMYWHSRLIYEAMDAHSSQVKKLAQSACEAILCKQWQSFRRGDLTRNATGWDGSQDDRVCESSIDLLIELGWIRDITPACEPGKRGRKSSGVFQVNPAVALKFAEKTVRIKQLRADRHAEILKVAGSRKEGGGQNVE